MPAVGILVGSGSDLPTMEKCTKRLEDLGVEHELEVLSAHRNPEAVAEYVAAAPERGINVFICAAGMAAHLAGAVAARTNLPVIGVPIAAGTLGGFDALLATVQMPTGIPVATVAVNGAANAAVLAAQILALGDSELTERLEG
ncbi:MAG: 5-(carboxyamino)imidazole ribonucleotide mutase [Rubrobacter sp.]|nr:5-(carboxyamino)imidazole ribonucleotide mutase [Rubrobacter sp.]